jgi:hypothetical protein
MPKTKLFRSIPNICLFLIFSASTLFGQYRAGLQGTVTDPNGSVVPDADVTLTSLETNIPRAAKTSGAGTYSIPSLAPGRYRLTVEKTGFAKKQLDDVTILAEQTQSVNVQLEIGQVSQTVTVSAGPPTLNTETATIGGTISSSDLQNLPSFGRDPFQLVRLAPGVFGDGAVDGTGNGYKLPGADLSSGGATNSIFGTENTVQVSANGLRANSNNIQVDGVGVNSATWNGAAVITPNESSIKEVQIVANNYSAENGRNSGGQLLVVSQNGTNEIHGNGFFKWHRPGLDAFQRWNGPAGPKAVQKDTNRFNQFGGSVGGPIKRDKLFAFFSYETLRNSSAATANNWYETPQFDQSAGASNSIARKFLSYPGEGPSAQTVLPFTCAQAGLAATQCRDVAGGLDLGSPLRTQLGTQDPTVGASGTPFGIGNGFDGVPDVQFLQTSGVNKNTAVQYNGRMDYQITSRDLATFSIYWVPVDTNSLNGPARTANLWNNSRLNQSYAALWNHTFGSTMINEARFNVSGWDWDEVASNSQAPFGLPQAQIDSLGTVAPQYFGPPGPSIFNQKTYNAKDTFTKVWGSHSIKVGGDVSWIKFLDTAPYQALPTYNFRNLWDFANDAPYQETGNFNPVTGVPTAATKHIRYNNIGVFVQDDWKLKPNLTLNLGLRWEDFTPVHETNNIISNPVLGPPGAQLTGISIKQGGDLFNNQIKNFAPQIGFAYTPGTQRHMVVRGGFGIGYNLSQLAVLSQGRFNPPQLTNLTLLGSNILYQPGSNVKSLSGYPSNPAAIQQFGSNGLPTSGGAISLNGVPNELPTTTTYRYSLETQFDLGRNWMASIGYQGSQTRHYTRQTDLSLLYYPALNPRVQHVYWFTNDVNAHYNALLTEVQHRFSNNFQVDVQYRYSRSIDAGSSDFYQDSYPWNLKYAVGPSDYDVTHNFKLYGVWSPTIFKNGHNWAEKIIGGWTISAILTMRSGFPWTPQYCVNQGNFLYQNSGLSCAYPSAYAGGATDYSTNEIFKTISNFPGGPQQFFTAPSVTGTITTPGIQRNSFRGPGYFGNDVTLSKDFGLPGGGFLKERAKITLQANFYNIFNKTNLLNVNNNARDFKNAANTFINNGTTLGNPQFGLSPGAFGGRIIELQAKFSF